DGLAGGPSDGGRSAVGAARHGYDRAVTAFQLGPVVLSAPRFYAGLALLVLVVVAELAAWGGRRAARAGEAVEATPAARRAGGEPRLGAAGAGQLPVPARPRPGGRPPRLPPARRATPAGPGPPPWPCSWARASAT